MDGNSTNYAIDAASGLTQILAKDIKVGDAFQGS
jgi:hypothetical protein